MPFDIMKTMDWNSVRGIFMPKVTTRMAYGVIPECTVEMHGVGLHWYFPDIFVNHPNMSIPLTAIKAFSPEEAEVIFKRFIGRCLRDGIHSSGAAMRRTGCMSRSCESQTMYHEG